MTSDDRRRDFADFLSGADSERAPSVPSSPEDPTVADPILPVDKSAPVIPSGMDSDSPVDSPSTELTDAESDKILRDTLRAQDRDPDDGTLDKIRADELAPEQRDRAEVIGTGGRWLAGWSLRFLVIAAAVYVGAQVFGKLWTGVLPILLAIIVCTVLWPVVRRLRAMKVPNALAVIITILGFFGVIGGILAAIAPGVIEQGRDLVYQANVGIAQVQDWLQGPPINLKESQLNDALNEATAWIQDRSGRIASELAAGASATLSVVITFFITLVLTFFFLKDGEHFLPMVRRVTGRRAGWHLTELLTRCWNTLGGFIRTQAIVSFVDAFFIGLGLFILGIPLAGALAVLTFLGGFIPMIGATVAGALSVLIALVSDGVGTALIVLAIVVAVQQLESHVLQPVLQSRAMNVHPVVILLSVTVGSALFNIWGAFLAVPVAAMIAVLLRYLGDLTDLATGEKTAQEITFTTTAGSLTGANSERAAKQWQAQRLADAAEAGNAPEQQKTRRSLSSLLGDRSGQQSSTDS